MTREREGEGRERGQRREDRGERESSYENTVEKYNSSFVVDNTMECLNASTQKNFKHIKIKPLIRVFTHNPKPNSRMVSQNCLYISFSFFVKEFQTALAIIQKY